MPPSDRCYACGISAYAQAKPKLPIPISQRPQTRNSPKIKSRKIKRTLKELDTPYKTWLNEDVVYIISPEERSPFLQLATNEEREQFIEQFWLRRSSNPDLPDNDFKEEHYRRIAYANEHFASGIPGWKTDRGRIYIIWGKPDEIESHPTGGTYDRPMDEGGGSTSTYPWERWRYRYLEGIQENVELEFVDPSGFRRISPDDGPFGERRVAARSGRGLEFAGIDGHGVQGGSFYAIGWHELADNVGGQPASMNEFTRLELYAKVQRPPEVKYKDLEALVTTRMVRDQVHFQLAHGFPEGHQRHSAGAGDACRCPIMQLTFKDKDGVHTAELNIFARVSTLTGRVVQTFEDSVTRDYPEYAIQAVAEAILDLPEGTCRCGRDCIAWTS